MEAQNINENNRNIPAEAGYSPEDAVFIALELGENILKSGGEISRAEETVSRICYAYGAETVDVIAILSTIIVTADFGGHSITANRRLSEFGTNNLGRLAKFNDLARRICVEKPSKDECLKRMSNIMGSTDVTLVKYLMGSMLTSIGFAVFFGDFSSGVTWELLGSLTLSAVVSGIIALFLGLIIRGLSMTKTNSLITKFIACLIGGVLAIIVGRVVPLCDVNVIMIGNIMNVIPGVAMTNAFRDMLGGDIMSGVFRLCSTLIDAVAIAAGYAVAILLIGGLV